MLRFSLLTLFITILSCSNSFSQKGKDAAKTVSVANTKINEFTALTANASAGNTTLTVAASSLNTNTRFATTLAAGDLIMIIQMQGALIKLSPVPVWAPDSTYGQVYSYGSCGNYEFAEVKSIVSATQIEINCGLTLNYSSAGKTQIVRVPRYSSLNIAATGTLTTDAWNGTIGGVLVAEVDGNTTINSGGLITTSGLGFRGGTAVGDPGSGNGNYATLSPNNGAAKGEGIGSDRITNLVNDTLGKNCFGAPANGGGGGNANNCGGGGGGNAGNILGWNGYGLANTTYSATFNLEYPGRGAVVSSGGGKGGYGTSTTFTPNVTTLGPNTTAWGSFSRPNKGGFGGRPLDYSTGKLFLGGGGGAGHMSTGQSNGANACSGGAGGGLVYLLNYGTVSGTGTIAANGANGNNAFGTGSIILTQGIDGAGGAGAGGTIILNSNGTISSIIANANGGSGGNQVKSGLASNETQGPGGGGGGGYIAGNGSPFVQTVNGGIYGTTNSAGTFSLFPMNGATSGNSGISGQVITPSFSLTASANQTLCTGQAATFTVTSNNPAATVLWYNSAAGGNSIASGTVYTSPTYTAAGTYTIYAGSCPGIYRIPITITINAGLSISINSPTICATQAVILTATSSATSYTWNTGANTNSISVTPSVTTVYTINATSASCSGSKTTTVTVTSAPSLTVANSIICAGSSTTLTATGATNYTWTPGGQTTSSIVVTPSVNTSYTITGANGTCTNTATTSVNVTSAPSLVTSPITICASQVATFTVSGATTYTWNPGNVTGSSYTISPATSTTVSVLGANGSCTAQVTTSLTVNPSPTITVNSATICSNQTVILTANGASTYTWNTGANTNSISVSPTVTSIYTINATNASCSSSKTATVTVSPQPTVSVANASICSGTTSTLIASGATNYTWMPGGQTTSSITVSPTVTTTYSITGANGTCTNITTSSVSVTPTPTLTVNSVTICPGNTATLTVSGASTYTWIPGNTTGSSYTDAPASSTTVSVVGANGSCTSQATASISVGSSLSIAVNTATICAGQTTTLIANGVTTYTWNTGANSNSITVSPSATTVYTVAGSSSGCNGINTTTVTVNTNPTITVNSASICSGQSATLTAIGANTYTWSNGVNTNTQTVSPASTTNYSVTGTNLAGCVSTTSITSTVSVTPTPTLTVNSVTICPGNTATLTVSGASTYTWIPGNTTGSSYTDTPASSTTVSVIGANGSCTSQATASISVGSSLSIAVNTATICAGQTTTLIANGVTTYTWNTGANSNSITVSPSATTVYTVAGSSSGCNGINTTTVTVNTNPTITVNSPSICSGQTATLNVSGANTYTWSNGVNTNTETVNPNTTTSYTVNGTALNGCDNIVPTILTVSVIATPTLVVNSPSVCLGNTATVTASGASSYTWNTGAITNSIVTAPSITTSYTIVGANGSCSTQTITLVTIDNTPSTTYTNAINSCLLQPVNLFAGLSNSASSYTWSNGVNTYSQTVAPNNSTLYTAQGSNANGCPVLSCTISVNVNSINSDFTGVNINNDILTVGTTLNLTNTSNGATNYLWSSCNGISTDTNITITLANTGTCCITLVASNASCSDTIIKCVDVVNLASINIPNVFTPNGDNINDLFTIHAVGIKTLHCSIFDRWGLKLYEWTGVSGSWDGNTHNGVKTTSGSYFYVVEYTDMKDVTTNEKGFFSLFRE